MQLIGHRGARREAPENTLGGFVHLRQLGIHSVELDLHVSADGKAVVIHDPTLDRTTDQRGRVDAITADQLQRVNAATQWPQWPHSEPVPTIREVLRQWPLLEHIQLEVKGAHPGALRQIIADALTVIEELELEEQCVFTSSDVNALHMARRLAPQIARGFVADRFKRAPVHTCAALHCDLLVLDFAIATPRLVHAAQSSGLSVSCWTVNDTVKVARLQRYGVDSIISDCPTRLQQRMHGWWHA